MNSLKTVQTFSTRIEAEMAKGLLEANGIKAIIFADDAGGARPFPMAFSLGVQLKVTRRNFEKARKIL